MTFKLEKHPRFPGRPGPLVLAVLDGVGIGAHDEADAVFLARKPALDRLWSPSCPHVALRAHGTAVGMPSDADMGNSEVGHNALGCGRVYDQGAKRVAAAIADRSLFAGAEWKRIVDHAGRGALHLIGLLSDGNVHSHIDHAIALVEAAAEAGVKRIFVHALLDGRDVEATSALRYVDAIEAVLAKVGGQGKIASGGGRMQITMDRYGADWDMVKRGWEAHVHGDARQFPSARAAIETFRAESPGIGDQNLPAFVIAKDGEPLGPIRDGDGVVFFNFRGDRAIEISRAFDDGDEFKGFDRGRIPKVAFAGMMQYDGDDLVPTHFLVSPPEIERTMGEYLVANGVTQLAISETQKFGHVTYFWNGNRSGMLDDKLETYIEIPSERLPFQERPWMKAAEITDRLVAELRTGKHRFARLNFANGDMVGHTGDRDATILAIECIDLQLARLMRVTDELGGILVVTADHGNADEMYHHDKKGRIERDSAGNPEAKTSHTLNPVPFMIYDPRRAGDGHEYQIDDAVAVAPKGAGLANVAATCMNLLGFERPDDEEPSLLRFG